MTFFTSEVPCDMSLSDPIADMLTRLRNGYRAEHNAVAVPHSQLKAEIARILKKEGFVSDYVVEGAVKKTLKIYLRYVSGRRSAIRGLKRESRPGLRRYVGWQDIPRVFGGLGLAILSTSRGLMTGKEARRHKVGGEWICSVW